ncbi:MAG: hypothetical protein LBD59_03770 [Prevotellaceae bacterium]|jgi:hypothetical protein|nr:hypothetical protein [Prevotellaceae bacterium]
MVRIGLIFILLLWSCGVKAQYVDYGDDPANIRWRQIKTEHYRLIFPENNERRANLYANILESIWFPVRQSMSAKRWTRIPVVMHPYSVRANGMVSWAPKRMELLPSPNFDSRFQLPDYSLLLHESRHVAQIDRLNQGTFRFVTTLLGEQGAGLFLLFVPQWLLEGDAVVAETALSSSGRGRIASFMMPYRAQVATGKNYSFDKWILGSYKDFTHDYYAVGYMFISHLRQKYGAEVWSSVMKDLVVRFPPLYTLALKRHTGSGQKKLMDERFRSLDSEYPAISNFDRPQQLSPSVREYTSWLYPQETPLGTVCLKQSLYDLPSIVIIDSAGGERRLTYTGTVNSKLSLAGDYIYWSEYAAGLRWTHQNYSIVRRLHLTTGKVENFTRRSRYFAPAPLADGSVSVFHHSAEGWNSVILLSAKGQELKSIQTPRNLPVQDMVADSGGNIFAAITGEGNGIFRIDTATGRWVQIIDYRRTNIENLRMHGGKLVFESGYSGISNIYALDTATLQITRLTNARFGAFGGTFSADGTAFYLSDYTAKGYKPASMPVAELNETPENFDRPYRFPSAEALSAQETFNIDTLTPVVGKYVSKPYRKALNLFNFHSWMPVFYDIDEVRRDFGLLIDFKPGVTLLSQNRLNTLVTQASYYYDIARNENHGFLSMKYSGLFPVFQVKANVGGRRISLDNYIDHGNQQHVNATFLAYLPFNFTRGSYVHGLQPYFYYRYSNMSLANRNFSYLNGGISYWRYRSLAHRDIFPKYGWQLWFDYVGAPKLPVGKLFVSKANIYLPGLVRSHGLKASLSFQKQNVEQGEYFFPQQYVEIARGGLYRVSASETLTVKGDYSFPVFYPDFSIGALAYFKRIRSNLFFDYTGNITSGFSRLNQTSKGIDLTFDVHLLRFALSSITLRLYSLNTSRNVFLWNLHFGMNI